MTGVHSLLAPLAQAAAALAQQEKDPEDGLSGFTGFAADVIDAMGEVGVGLLAFVETVFPPIPSEIILSLAGYLAERGRMNVGLVVFAATLGSVLGALVLYALGAWFGEERAKYWMERLPLVEMRDLNNASAWFHRHGQGVVFFGRFIPIVRSMVSLPAGAQRMPLAPFVVLTTAGSAIWNGALVGAGYALGTQYDRIEDYTQYLDYLAGLGVVAFLAWFVTPRLWRRWRRGPVRTG
jgi:membrane protein DedA with SNARE-associated domain